MSNMKEKIIYQLKILKKIKLLMLALVGIIVLIVGFSLYLGSSGVDTLLYMQQIGNYSYYICSVFTIICYMFLTYSQRNDLDETLKVTDSMYRFYSVILLFMILCIISIIMFLMILYVVIGNQSTNQLFSIYIPSFFLNIFFPLCISLFIAFLLSCLSNTNRSSVLLIIYVVLSSPLFYLNVEQGLPQRIMDAVLQPFHFMYRGDDFSMDYMYGLKDEFYRWFIVLAYIFAIVGTLVVSQLKGRKRTIGMGLTVCCILGSLGYSLRPQSTLDVTKSQFELLDLTKGEKKEYYKKYVPVDYQFGDYDFDIEMNAILNVKGTMKLSSQTKKNEYIFTLYRGYKIKELTADQSLHYDRENDIVKVLFDEPTDKANIKIAYSGYHPTFYSNKQAVALPGYFPWYPMSGEHQVTYSVEYGAYGYNPLNRIEPTYASLKIESDFPIVTNLDKKSDNHYEGNVDSITLFGGHIETGNEIFMNQFPAEHGMMFSKDDELSSLMESYNQCIENLKIYNLDPKLIEGKKVIMQPKSLTYFSDINTIIIFDDYIIAQDGYVYMEYIMRSLMLDMASKSMITYCIDLCVYEDIYKSKESLYQFYSSVAGQQKGERLNTIIENMTNQEFVDEFYPFALGQTQYQSDEEFLQAMEVKYDRD